MELYHVTALRHLPSILAEGLRSCVYLAATDELVDYYRETVEDEGDTPVVLQIALSALRPEHCEPDHPGLDEPITSAIDLDEDELREAWEASDGTWEDCLALIGSLRYRAVIDPAHICVQTEQDSILLKDYLAMTA